MTDKTATKTASTTKASKTSLPASAPKAASAPPVTKKSTSAQASTTAAPAVKPKHKLVRDSFTIPKSEYLVLEALKLRAAALARPVKKSELLRAGIGALNAMNDKALLTAVNQVPSLKTGRPSGVKTTTPPTRNAK